MNSLKEQTFALASMFQSARLINQLANGQPINQAAFDCSMDSLFTLNANSIEDIYGYGDGLLVGLKTLLAYLGGAGEKPERQMIYYVLSMTRLQRRLMKDAQLVDKIQQGLQAIEQQASDFELSQTARAHKIDGLYRQTISHLLPRIIVQGDQTHLSNSDTTSKVRTLLFAGIRAAVLWRQKGGNRWKLIFKRKQIMEQTEQLLRQLG